MSAPSLNITPASEASLAQRIVLNDPTAWSSLPEAYTDEQWRREAQACLDCDDEAPLHWMIAQGLDAERQRDRQWQHETGRYSLNDYRDGNGPHPLMGRAV